MPQQPLAQATGDRSRCVVASRQERDRFQKWRDMRSEFRDAGIPVEILDALDKAGFVIVSKEPFASMVEYAYEEALAENAEGVWRNMLTAWDQVSPALAMGTLKEAISCFRASDTPNNGS